MHALSRPVCADLVFRIFIQIDFLTILLDSIEKDDSKTRLESRRLLVGWIPAGEEGRDSIWTGNSKRIRVSDL